MHQALSPPPPGAVVHACVRFSAHPARPFRPPAPTPGENPLAVPAHAPNRRCCRRHSPDGLLLVEQRPLVLHLLDLLGLLRLVLNLLNLALLICACVCMHA